MDPETPEADAAEQVQPAQETPASESADEVETPVPAATPAGESSGDVDPADLADQRREVPDDDPSDRG